MAAPAHTRPGWSSQPVAPGGRGYQKPTPEQIAAGRARRRAERRLEELRIERALREVWHGE